MFKWLLPRETSFFDLFDKHASVILEASQQLNFLTEPGANILAKVQKIKDLEHEADSIAHQCVESLHKTFITPFERNDIFRLISRMDDIVDFIKDTATRIEIYKLMVITSDMREMAGVLLRSSEELLKVIKGLRDLKNADFMRQSIVQINHLEKEGDFLLQQAIGRLFDEESDARMIIKWKEIYENLENAIDRCEDVSNIIEGVILEND